MSKFKPTHRYWDSCAFIAFLRREDDRVAQCRAILNAADNGKTQIITSAFTLSEVLWISPKKKYDESSKQKVRQLFERSSIHIIDFTRFVAEEARELKWKYPDIHIEDANHLATVISSTVTLFETYDRVLLEYDNKFKNSLQQKIRILRPSFTEPKPDLPY